MANRAIEPVTLPWKRPEKGVSAAELGASFRVEQREGGWHCTVKVGRRVEVLATGMRRLRDAQCRAEAHAATLPEVAAALEQQAAESGAKREPAKMPATPAKAPRGDEPVAPPSDVAPALTFEEVSEGCICGKIDGRTWLADPDGGVSVPLDTDPAVAREICRVATNYYTARRAKPTASPRAKSTARASTKKTAKRARGAAAKREQEAAKPATPPPPAATKNMPRDDKKAAAKKGAASKASTSKASASKASASKASEQPKVAKARSGKAASKKAAAKATTPKEPAVRGRKGGKASAAPEKQAATPTPPAKEEKVSKKPEKTTKTAKDASCGCVTWAAVENKIRGMAKHGTFVVEPEGKRHALYFYDADGQSRHLESGEPGKLRKVAEEMAARGQPVLRAPTSGVDDAALMRAFLGDDA